MKFSSKAEKEAAPVIAALGGRPCDSFAPFLLPIYQDAEGVEMEGKPDFIIPRRHGEVFIELKDGALNNHYNRESSREALATEYVRICRSPPTGMSHGELSTALHRSGKAGYLATLAEAFNHSLWKVRALQAQHGWRRYVVCFVNNPKPADAARYAEAGLIWCTLAKLEQFLIRIDLEEEGVPIPYFHQAMKFGYTVVFDDRTATQVEARSHFLNLLDQSKAKIVASQAKADAEIAAGVMPF